MNVSCVFCHRVLDDNEARFASCKGLVAHPDCLFEGYPDAEGLQWRFAPGSRSAPQEVQIPVPNGTVQIAIIKHEDGVLAHAATSMDELYEKVYSYVALYWSQFYGDDTMPEDHMEAVEAYFENNSDEYLDFDSSDI